MNSVPKDVLLGIFSYLPASTLCSCSRVCRLWHDTCWFACSTLSFKDASFTVATFAEKFPPLLQRCCNVTGWEFNRCSFINDSNLESLAPRLKTLKSLHLIGCSHITTSVCQIITTHCSMLEDLNIKDSKRILTPTRVGSIALPPTLISLNTEGCFHITDELVRSLTTMCSSLQVLRLKGCYRLTDASIKHILTNLPHLRVLGIEGLKRISNNSFLGLTELKKEIAIQSIDMRMCDSIDDDAIATLASHCPKLQQLVLKFCERLTNKCASFITRLPVQHLDLQGTGIGDEGMDIISTGCTSLTTLDLRDCDQLTAEGYRSISQLKLLKQLRLRANKVDDAGVLPIVEHCTNLTLLDLEGCSNISENAVSQMKACKHLARMKCNLITLNV